MRSRAARLQTADLRRELFAEDALRRKGEVELWRRVGLIAWARSEKLIGESAVSDVLPRGKGACSRGWCRALGSRRKNGLGCGGLLVCS